MSNPTRRPSSVDAELHQEAHAILGDLVEQLLCDPHGAHTQGHQRVQTALLRAIESATPSAASDVLEAATGVHYAGRRHQLLRQLAFHLTAMRRLGLTEPK